MQFTYRASSHVRRNLVLLGHDWRVLFVCTRLSLPPVYAETPGLPAPSTDRAVKARNCMTSRPASNAVTNPASEPHLILRLRNVLCTNTRREGPQLRVQ
ncbi:hypothetical protein BDY17DRAFT_23190 [Neohortaea acidophila]|uniref:Uncharacterized protein n=1 Tax=Neohortaea acidophila TaxID=245834 RepID=A0A6A6Q7S9_9PEZI|nr:uncharacterized protein BDY17DRAFT_23190 [Neohortaea acidophila]KAF2488054.1 hypothetical protein BDY17DRAFT_23190 [Neohortaea acidophila]